MGAIVFHGESAVAQMGDDGFLVIVSSVVGTDRNGQFAHLFGLRGRADWFNAFFEMSWRGAPS